MGHLYIICLFTLPMPLGDRINLNNTIKYTFWFSYIGFIQKMFSNRQIKSINHCVWPTPRLFNARFNHVIIISIPSFSLNFKQNLAKKKKYLYYRVAYLKKKHKIQEQTWWCLCFSLHVQKINNVYLQKSCTILLFRAREHT